ncbi:hypothetical protein NUW54_g7926 [Trametes sanguinea]|uniref:Uncharacterized protein n=1 Tax=Trametes sanguinea TaxID=158606 RepID=A0ACC1PH31_9APHY|nr:hypothetical protein NUW54_g7926 [Trametes sanguinea]
MVLCMGYMGRLGSVGLRTAARPALSLNASHAYARSLSTLGLQRPRVLAQSDFRSLQQRSLSLWGSSKPSAPVAQAEPTPAETSASVQASTTDATSEPEPVPSESLSFCSACDLHHRHLSTGQTHRRHRRRRLVTYAISPLTRACAPELPLRHLDTPPHLHDISPIARSSPRARPHPLDESPVASNVVAAERNE